MIRVRCIRCGSSPTITPMKDVTEYYIINNNIILCERCLEYIVEDWYEQVEIKELYKSNCKQKRNDNES